MNGRLEQGNNNITMQVGDRIIKSRKEGAIHEQTYEQQAEQWNAYYQGTPLATARVTQDGKLSTPFIEGSYPSPDEHLSILEEMQYRGFAMGDGRDKRNFIVTPQGKICPVDFGQVYQLGSSKFYSANKIAFDKFIIAMKNNKLTLAPAAKDLESLKKAVSCYLSHLKIKLNGNGIDCDSSKELIAPENASSKTRKLINRYNTIQKLYDDISRKTERDLHEVGPLVKTALQACEQNKPYFLTSDRNFKKSLNYN